MIRFLAGEVVPRKGVVAVQGKYRRKKRKCEYCGARIIEFRASGIGSIILAIAVLVKVIQGLIQALMGLGQGS